MRLFLRLFIYLFGSVLALLLFIMTTEQGLHLGFNLVNYALGHSLKIKSLHGRLLDHVTGTGFSYDRNGESITLDDIDITWQPSALLKNSLVVDKLNATNGKIIFTQTDYQFPTPTHFILHNISLKNISIKTPELLTPLNIKQLNLDADSQQHHYAIVLDASSGANRVSLSGKYHTIWDLQWNLQAPKLNELLANSQGSISSQGKINNKLTQFEFNNVTTLNNLRYKNWIIPQLLLQGKGSEKQHQLALNYTNKQQQLKLMLQGQYKSPRWQGTISMLSLPFEQKNYFSQLVGARVALEYLNHDLTLNITSPTKAQQLAATFLLPKISWENTVSGKQAISGKIKLIDPKLQLLSLFIPSQKISGQMKINLDLAGTLGQPQPTGNLELNNGTLPMEDLKITLNNLNLKINSNPKGEMEIKGSARSGKGIVTVNGKSNWHQIEKTTEINLVGKDFAIANTHEYQASINPQLKLWWQNNSLMIKGQITVPAATLKPVALAQSQTVTRDIIFTDEKKAPPTVLVPFQVVSDIKLILGDEVYLKLDEIHGQLHGAITIHDTNDEESTAVGEITISDGEYQAYGKPMTIREGRLIFDGGPVSNPGMRLIAYRTLKFDPSRFDNEQCRSFTSNPQLPKFFDATRYMINIGIQVTGRIDDRQVSLFAEPAAFSQADILSMLVLGEPLCTTKQGDSKMLISALSAMSMSGSTLSQVQQQIAHTFGLDEFTITSVTERDKATAKSKTGAALVLGKALTPKLYISYIFNALSNAHTVRVRYYFTQHWVIQSEQSTAGTAADILYTFER